MTFKESEKHVTKKLRDFEKEDLEEYCRKNNIKGTHREIFIENSLKSIISTENGETE